MLNFLVIVALCLLPLVANAQGGPLQGDLSGANVKATGATTSQSSAALAAERYTALHFGLTGDNTADDTAKMQNLLNAAGGTPAGGTNTATTAVAQLNGWKTYYIASSITIPANTTLDCGVNPGAVALGAATSGALALNTLGGLRLASSATINLSPGSGLKNCFAAPHGVTFPVSTVSGYAGTAITLPGANDTSDTTLENVLLVGFAQCTDSSPNSGGQSRAHWQVECDATNGFKFGQSGDSMWLHLRNWPWGTVGTAAGIDLRSGTGYLFTGASRNDDVRGEIFDHGHAIGIDVKDPSAQCCNIHFMSGWFESNATTAVVNEGANLFFSQLWLFNDGQAFNNIAGFTTIGNLYGASISAGNCAAVTAGVVMIVTGGASGCTDNLSRPLAGGLRPNTTLNITHDVASIGTGQIVMNGVSDATKAMWFGLDTTDNVGIVQAYKNGTGPYPLELQPNGGNVYINGYASIGALVAPLGAFSVFGNASAPQTGTNAASVTLGLNGGEPTINLDDGAGNANVAGNQYNIDNQAGTLRIYSAGTVFFTLSSAGVLNTSGGFSSGGTAGVNCSGSPTGSFASVHGVVTHC